MSYIRSRVVHRIWGHQRKNLWRRKLVRVTYIHRGEKPRDNRIEPSCTLFCVVVVVGDFLIQIGFEVWVVDAGPGGRFRVRWEVNRVWLGWLWIVFVGCWWSIWWAVISWLSFSEWIRIGIAVWRRCSFSVQQVFSARFEVGHEFNSHDTLIITQQKVRFLAKRDHIWGIISGFHLVEKLMVQFYWFGDMVHLWRRGSFQNYGIIWRSLENLSHNIDIGRIAVCRTTAFMPCETAPQAESGVGAAQ